MNIVSYKGIEYGTKRHYSTSLSYNTPTEDTDFYEWLSGFTDAEGCLKIKKDRILEGQIPPFCIRICNRFTLWG